MLIDFDEDTQASDQHEKEHAATAQTADRRT